jgi:uncharacterized RDD family membrane protein YckC
MVLLAALLMIGALPFVLVSHDVPRAAFQLYLLALAGAYFPWHWLHGGQTLPMKTWRLRLVARDGGPLTALRAFKRFAAAAAGSAAFGIGFLWALVDPEGLFLHDRLAGTAIVKAEDERRKEKE